MVYRIVVGHDAARLDNYLARECDHSRSIIRKIIDLGGVHISGRRIRKVSRSVFAGEKIEVHRDNMPLSPFRLEEEHIHYIDKHIIVINKPSGVLTQPNPARYKGTLYEALQYFLREKGVHSPQIGMHQRLDVGTSGLLVFSIHQAAHKKLAEQIHARTVQRVYLAMVEGVPNPTEGTICSRLARRHRDNRVVSVEKGGKEAVTHYQVMQQFDDFSLLAVRLETGRSHQIRVHCSEKGHPLLGDTFYGGMGEYNGTIFSFPALHSWKLAMCHPITGKTLEWSIPLPVAFPFIRQICLS